MPPHVKPLLATISMLHIKQHSGFIDTPLLTMKTMNLVTSLSSKNNFMQFDSVVCVHLLVTFMLTQPCLKKHSLFFLIRDSCYVYAF